MTTANWIAKNGSWSNAANWDTNSVPDASTDAVITASGSTDAISGSGSSASLALSGSVSLSGQFTTGGVSLVNYGTQLTIASGSSLNDTGVFNAAYASGTTVVGSLALGTYIGSFTYVTLNGGSITAVSIQASPIYTSDSNSYTVTAGKFEVTGGIFRGSSIAGDSFSVSGAINNNSGQFLVDGTVQLGGDSVNASVGGVIRFSNVATQASSSDYFTVDASSSIEIGSSSGPAAGTITIDAGQTLVDGGSLSAPIIVDNGLIEVGAGESLTVNGTGTGLIGSGAIQIDAGAALSLAAVGGQSQNSISFVGGQALLSFSHSSLNVNSALLPAISGFDSTDRLNYQGDLTNAIYTYNNNNTGTLTLLNGGIRSPRSRSPAIIPAIRSSRRIITA
jgi:hypothetical protein